MEFKVIWDTLVFQAGIKEDDSLAFLFLHTLPANLQAEAK